jgi:hypothetical protein
MVKITGRNTTTYDSVDAPLPIALNTTTYTELGDVDHARLGYILSNDSSHDIIVKEDDIASPDSQDRGFIVYKRSTYETPQDLIPVGKISAKAKTGTPTVMIVFK